MDPAAIIMLIVLVILLVLSGFFSSAETALTTVNLNILKALSGEGGRKAASARRVLKMREDPGRLLSTILIGNNIVNITASSLTTVLVSQLFGNRFIGYATGILTLIVLIFGEITPKSLANAYSENMALLFSGPISFLMVIFTPVIWIIDKLCRIIFRILGLDPDKDPNEMTERELRVVIGTSEQAGVIETDEKKMINNTLDFGDALSRDIMIPRADMICADINVTEDELISLIRDENCSRIPVYEESKDHIVGILHIKDFFLDRESRQGGFDLRKLLRKPVFVYEYQRTAQIFADMKTSSSSMCIVLDEYGITSGLITMEDLVEEIVGEIRDEYDEGESNIIKKLSDGVYDVDGSVRLDDLNDAIGTELKSDNYDSIAGLVIEVLDRLPAQGDIAENDQAVIKVIKLDHNRAQRVRITVKKKEEEEEPGSED